jgi:hypothetical protein
MESPPQRQIFRLYWRSFLPFWLLPIPATAVILLAHFASESTAQVIVPYLFAVMFIGLVLTQLRPLALWRRRRSHTGKCNYYLARSRWLVLFAWGSGSSSSVQYTVEPAIA